MRAVKILACAAVLIFLGGCFDYNELNMQELVNGAGIDVSGDKVSVHVLCAATGGEEEKQGVRYTSEGSGFFDAVRNVGGEADKKLYWGHARCLVIGEQAAERTDEILDTVIRAQDVYLDIAPVIAKGTSAKDVLDTKPPGGRDVTDSISSMFANEANSRRFRAVRVWEILRERESAGVYILPTVTVEDGAPYLSGGAVMRGGKISGYLSGEQMLLLSLMTDDGPGGYLPPLELSDERRVSFEILANDIKKKESGGRVRIEQKCVLSPAEVRGDVSADEMENAAKKYLDESFAALISYAKTHSLGDIFSTGGKEIDITSDVRVSNILGGRK